MRTTSLTMSRRSQLSLLFLLCAVLGGLQSSASLQDSDYFATLPEDPLQPVWDNLDALPAEILSGLRDHMKSYSMQMQASLAQILGRLSTLEDKTKQGLTDLREEIGDLVTDRLVNAESLVLESIADLSNRVTSCARENCGIQEHAASLVERLEETVNATVAKATATCFSRIEAGARIEESTQRLQEAAVREDEASQRLQEAAVRMEAAAQRLQISTARMEEAAARMEEVEVAAQRNETQQLSGDAAEYRAVRAAHLSRDCSDIHWQQPEAPSGVYRTFPTLDPKTPVSAYCDMGSAGANKTGGWTVLLRRQNSSWGLEDFNRSWVEYREGFGQPGQGEWWYGLAPLHALTYLQPFEVELTLHDMELGTFQATYTSFRVESEGRDFRLLVRGFSGNVTYDALSSMHHGKPFSTFDRDLDAAEGNCAASNGGGWWYQKCHKAALTATFPTSPINREARAIRWYTPTGWLVLNDVTMKIRPTNYGQRFQSQVDGE